MVENADLEINENDLQKLNGITVGGEHLGSWLRHKSSDEKTKDILKTRTEHIAIHHGKHRPYPKKAKQDIGPRVSKRVRRLTDREIRKEYGVMSRPYDSLSENIIWTMVEKGPISSQEIKDLLKFEKNNSAMAAMITGIWHRVGDEGAQLIVREKKKGNLFYEYKKRDGVELSTDAIIEQYRLWGKREYRESELEKRRLAFLDTLTDQEREEELAREAEQKKADEYKKAFKESEKRIKNGTALEMDEQAKIAAEQQPGHSQNLVQQLGQTIGININVTGSIKFLFGIELDKD
jgi:hypothetical protein